MGSGRHAALRPPRRAPAATPRSGRHAGPSPAPGPET